MGTATAACHTAWTAGALLVVSSALSFAAPVPGGECAGIFAESGVPELDGDTEHSADGHTFVCRQGYALWHNNLTHIPDWVAEDVTLDEITGEAVRRDNFAIDPMAPPPDGATLEDYRGSGFDRGHQAPAADFKSDQVLTDESFFLSNMAPQVGRCFNRGIWANLEAAIRDWVRTRKRLIVFTGPIYPDPLVTIGDKVAEKAGVDIAVPEAFYKVVYHPRTKRAVGFILPNEKLCEQDPADFTEAVDRIEELTGIDFFTALTHRQQQLLERDDGNMWGW